MSANLAPLAISVLLAINAAAIIWLRVHRYLVLRLIGCAVLIVNCILCFMLSDYARSAEIEGTFVLYSKNARIGPLLATMCLIFLHRGMAESLAQFFREVHED